MARLTRQQLKKDEVGTSLASSMGYVLKHRRGTVRWLEIAAGVLLVIVGIFWYVGRAQTSAASAFTKALSTYHALVVPTVPASVTIETYRTNEERNQKALEAFQAVADQYSWYRPGRLARYYIGLCLRDLGKHAEAETQLKEVAQSSDRRLAGLAKVALASIYEVTDRTVEADALYKELEANPTETVPKSTALMARAALYRKTNPTEAANLYQQIQRDYPGSIAAQRAAQMLTELQP